VTRTGIIARSALGIIGSAFLLFCGGWVALFAFAISIDAPHAWKGDIRFGLIYGLIALALIIGRRPFAPRFNPPFALTACPTDCRNRRAVIVNVSLSSSERHNVQKRQRSGERSESGG